MQINDVIEFLALPGALYVCRTAFLRGQEIEKGLIGKEEMEWGTTKMLQLYRRKKKDWISESIYARQISNTR